MKPSIDSIITYDFLPEEIANISDILRNPLLRAYLISTFAQMRETLLEGMSPNDANIQNSRARADHILAYISGAQELLDQIIRLEEDTHV